MRGGIAAALVALAALSVLAAPAAARETSATALLAPPKSCPGSDFWGVQPSTERTALLCLVNWARVHAGLPRLRHSPALDRAARRKGGDVARCGALRHDPCGAGAATHVRQQGYRFRDWSENLYFGQRWAGTPRQAVRAWLLSPGHRANMLDPMPREIGAARLRVEGVEGMGRGALWVLQLARPR